MKGLLITLGYILVVILGSGCSMKGSSIRELEETVIRFKNALLEPDEESLSVLVSDSLSYGHSSGVVENKARFIEALLQGTSNFKSIDITDQRISVVENVAVVRHILSAHIHDKDKPESHIRLHILMVWVKHKGDWVLIARQAVRL